MLIVFDILLAILIPFITIKFSNKWLIKKLGIVGSNYLFGIAYALIVFLMMKLNVISNRDTSVLEILSYVAISFSIPFLLYKTNLKEILKLSKKSILSFILLTISVVIVTTLTYILFSKNIDNGDTLSGMAVGLYTGGTPNLNAIGYFYGLDTDTILMSNISDIIFGGIFYVFLIFVAKPFTRLILKNKDNLDDFRGKIEENNNLDDSKKGIIRNIITTLLVVIISACVGLLIWILNGSVDGTMTNYLVPALMLGTTILGLILSNNKRIRNVKSNDSLGQYFACIFSFSISSMINFTNFNAVAINIFIHFAIVTTCTFLLHLLLCKIFKISSEMMITSATAGIYGPAFIPSVTKSIDASYLLPVGLILGSIGYAVGTFLGIGITQILRLL